MSRRFPLPALLVVALLGACSDDNVAPRPDDDVRGQILDDAGRPVADAAVFLEYELETLPGVAARGIGDKPQLLVRFQLPTPMAASVWLSSYCDTDTLRLLVSGLDLPAGEHAVVWDGRDGDGRLAPDGVYRFHVVTTASQATSDVLVMHDGYADLTAATAVAAPARSTPGGHYRLERDCLPLGHTFPQIDFEGNPIATMAVAHRVRVWASHPDHGLGHSDWRQIDDTRGLAVDVTLTP